MSSEAIKNARTQLRRVLEHIESAGDRLNVHRESIGFVDVVVHPDTSMPDLNYVTPRRNTAWIGGEAILEGLDYLHHRGRDARFFYVEGLIPPQFSQTLAALNLIEARRSPIMVYATADVEDDGQLTDNTIPVSLRVEVPVESVSSSLSPWEQISQDGEYTVSALHLEPVVAGSPHTQADLVICDGVRNLGLARISINATLRTAHIVATALHEYVQTPGMARLLYSNVLRYAVEHGADMIFTSAPAGVQHLVLRELGAVEMGSAVFYADPARSAPHKDTRNHERLADSLLSLYPSG